VQWEIIIHQTEHHVAAALHSQLHCQHWVLDFTATVVAGSLFAAARCFIIAFDFVFSPIIV
jgi:hypothetical protein